MAAVIVLVSLELDCNSGADTIVRIVDAVVDDVAIFEDATGVVRVIEVRGTCPATSVVLI